MKKILKNISFIVILCIIVIWISSLFVNVSAALNPEYYNPGNNTGSAKLSNIGNKVLGILNFVGAFVAVAMLMIIGVKFMTASIEEKAKYKSTMFPYILGAILLFSGTTFLNVVYKLVITVKV